MLINQDTIYKWNRNASSCCSGPVELEFNLPGTYIYIVFLADFTWCTERKCLCMDIGQAYKRNEGEGLGIELIIEFTSVQNSNHKCSWQQNMCGNVSVACVECQLWLRTGYLIYGVREHTVSVRGSDRYSQNVAKMALARVRVPYIASIHLVQDTMFSPTSQSGFCTGM